jgi:hypothetical protein
LEEDSSFTVVLAGLCSISGRYHDLCRYRRSLVATESALARYSYVTLIRKQVFMIRTEVISPNALKIIAPEKLKVEDFRQIAPQVDSIIRRYGKIRLLIDASQFSGWENIAAFENHAAFVKHHQDKVQRIAVIVGHEWQHWLVGTVRIFVHPEVKAYDKGQEREALHWIAAESLADGR